MMSDPRADLGRFYALLSRLETTGIQGKSLADLRERSCFPARGVYFFREPGEFRASNSSVHRIVRVGTHALKAGSRATLWNRLSAHRGTPAGGGNHRGSVFRLHVGAALLAREGRCVPTWGVGASAPPALRGSFSAKAEEAACEEAVSRHIASMTVLWVDVPDEPGPENSRAYIERNAIALASNVLMPMDPPSPNWLGHHSPKEKIRRSGLWNLNHVDESYDPQFLHILERAVNLTCDVLG